MRFWTATRLGFLDNSRMPRRLHRNLDTRLDALRTSRTLTELDYIDYSRPFWDHQRSTYYFRNLRAFVTFIGFRRQVLHTCRSFYMYLFWAMHTSSTFITWITWQMHIHYKYAYHRGLRVLVFIWHRLLLGCIPCMYPHTLHIHTHIHYTHT